MDKKKLLVYSFNEIDGKLPHYVIDTIKSFKNNGYEVTAIVKREISVENGSLVTSLVDNYYFYEKNYRFYISWKKMLRDMFESKIKLAYSKVVFLDEELVSISGIYKEYKDFIENKEFDMGVLYDENLLSYYPLIVLNKKLIDSRVADRYLRRVNAENKDIFYSEFINHISMSGFVVEAVDTSDCSYLRGNIVSDKFFSWDGEKIKKNIKSCTELSRMFTPEKYSYMMGKYNLADKKTGSYKGKNLIILWDTFDNQQLVHQYAKRLKNRKNSSVLWEVSVYPTRKEENVITLDKETSSDTKVSFEDRSLFDKQFIFNEDNLFGFILNNKDKFAKYEMIGFINLLDVITEDDIFDAIQVNIDADYLHGVRAVLNGHSDINAVYSIRALNINAPIIKESKRKVYQKELREYRRRCGITNFWDRYGIEVINYNVAWIKPRSIKYLLEIGEDINAVSSELKKAQWFFLPELMYRIKGEIRIIFDRDNIAREYFNLRNLYAIVEDRMTSAKEEDFDSPIELVNDVYNPEIVYVDNYIYSDRLVPIGVGRAIKNYMAKNTKVLRRVFRKRR